MTPPKSEFAKFSPPRSGPLPLNHLLEKAKVTRAVVERLEKRPASRAGRSHHPGEDPWDTDFTPPTNVLNAEQKKALEEIWRWLVAGKFAPACSTASPAAERPKSIWARSRRPSRAGRTAIVLVPEIALTLWVGRLVRARFGESVAVLHSGLPDIERAREWWRVRHGEARIVVGTRSAVFAPLENLGLIIVDEEQESSYKQEETPRYNGRDMAVYRARLENAVVLLGLPRRRLRLTTTPAPENISCSSSTSRVRKPSARRSPHRGPARGIPPPASRRADFGSLARRHRPAPGRRNAGHGADQSPRLFLVAALPRLRRNRAMPELQHRAHLSQKPPAPGMPLLRLFDSPAEAMPEMPRRIYVFRR